MNLKKKRIVTVLMAMGIIFGTLCTNLSNSQAASSVEANNTSTYEMNADDKNQVYPDPCPGGRRGGPCILKDSVAELKESGTLTSDDVKNIENYMAKERSQKQAEVKEKIYNLEAEKIDNMIDQKIITKEKGNKLKTAIRENIEEMAKNKSAK